MPQWRSIRLAENLCAEAERRWSGRVGTLEDLLTLFLEEVNRDQGAQLDEAEEQMIEERLRDLGYI